MNEDNIRALLANIQVSTYRATYTGSKKNTRWLTISCPFAPWTHARAEDSRPSFGITISDDRASHYKCLACNLKGRLAALPTKLGGYRKKDYQKFRHWAEIAEFETTASRPVPDWEAEQLDEDYETKKSLPNPAIIDGYPLAMDIKYLAKRGVLWPTPLKLGLRFDPYQRRVLFPCYDAEDRFRGFTGRSVQPEHMLHKKNPKVRDYFGLDKRELLLGLRGKQSGVNLLVEGLLDYAIAVQNGFPATKAIMGTAMTDEKVDMLIRSGDPVYLFLDNDLAGWQAMFGVPDDSGGYSKENAWAFALYEEVPVWIVPYKRNLSGEDPGSLTKKEMQDAVNNAWLFTGKRPLDSFDEPISTRPRSVNNL